MYTYIVLYKFKRLLLFNAVESNIAVTLSSTLCISYKFMEYKINSHCLSVPLFRTNLTIIS